MKTTRRGRLLKWLPPAGLVCLFPLFFVGGPGWSDGPLFKAVWNLGHPIFFALLTLAVRPWRFLKGWELWAISTAAVVLLGFGIEVAQSYTHRDIDLQDMLRNLIGLWAVLAVLHSAGFAEPWPGRDRLIRVFAVLLLAMEIIPVSRVAIQQFQVSRWLPELYDFQQAHPERFWQGRIARDSAENCGSVTEDGLSIALSTRQYSGASLHNLPSDWRAYEGLQMAIWNPQDMTIPITLRINDRAHEETSNQYHDRFNQRFYLTPGLNRIHQPLENIAESPRDRTMNMDHIRRLMIFTSNMKEPGRICLVRLRLTSRHDAATRMD